MCIRDSPLSVWKKLLLDENYQTEETIYQSKCDCVEWQQHWMILHNNSSSDPVRCERQVGSQRMMIPKPKAISNYNQFMYGVDLHDQLRKRYACGRPSKKYWKYLLWFIVDCCRVNAYIVCKESSIKDNEEKAIHSPGIYCWTWSCNDRELHLQEESMCPRISAPPLCREQSCSSCVSSTTREAS